MIEEMVQFSLGWLYEKFGGDGPVEEDLFSWFLSLDSEQPPEYAALLVEPRGKVDTYYSLSADPNDPEVAILKPGELTDAMSLRMPFNQASGPRSPALGPVIKRSKSPAKVSPTPVIMQKTLDSFAEIAERDVPWATFFAEAKEVWGRPKLSYMGEIEESGNKTAYERAVGKIETGGTVLLTFVDREGRFPGERPEYLNYLKEVLATTKYAVKVAPGIPQVECSLTGHISTCYVNGLAGSGINILNMDRDGAFPGLLPERAGQRFRLCREVCDLLYIFKFHILPDLVGYTGGGKSAVLPRLETLLSPEERQEFYRAHLIHVQELSKGKTSEEDYLLDLLIHNNAVGGLLIIWADIGQRLENITGILPDVLPSRLRIIQQKWTSLPPTTLGPEFPVAAWQITARLNGVYELFKRPGGKKAETENANNLVSFARDLVCRIYQGQALPDSRIILHHTLAVARFHLRDILEDPAKRVSGMFSEFASKKNTDFGSQTMASRIRHTQLFIEFLYTLKLLAMTTESSTFHEPPDCLRPFLYEGSGLNTNGKAQAFVLGVLFGRMLEAQKRRGVNVAANGLTYIKDYKLHPRDASRFHAQVWSKLQQYFEDPRSKIHGEWDYYFSGSQRKILEELNAAVAKYSDVGRPLDLNQDEYNYFILLGQSVSRDVFKNPKKKDAAGESQPTEEKTNA